MFCSYAAGLRLYIEGLSTVSTPVGIAAPPRVSGAFTHVGLLLSFADLTSCSRIGLFFVLSGAWLAMAASTIAVSPIIQRRARHLAGRLVLN
jgi:hypothetical protein